jgi:hypothetical protein
VVEKIYQFDLKNMSENSLEFHPISSYTTAKNSLEIELGEIILENSSNTLYELSTPVLSWTNSNGALKGELFIQNDKLFLRLESLEKIKNYMKPRVDNILIFPKDLKIISRENRSRSSTQSVNVGELLPDISLNSLFPSSQLVLTDIYGNLLNQVIISHGILYSVDGNSSVSTTVQVQREGFLSTIFDPINAHDINVYVQGTSISSGQSITVPLTSNSSNGAILNSSLSISISTTTDFFGLIQNAQIDLGSNISPAAISKAYPGDYGATIEFIVEVE